MSQVKVGTFMGVDVMYDTNVQKFVANLPNETISRAQRKDVEKELAKRLDQKIRVKALRVNSYYRKIERIDVVGIRRGQFSTEYEYIDSRGRKFPIPSNEVFRDDPELMDALIKLTKEKEEFEASWDKKWEEARKKLKFLKVEEVEKK